MAFDHQSPVSESSTNQSNNATSSPSLLNELGKGTFGLRKVDKSEMTHKNPALRQSGAVPENLNPKDAPKAGLTTSAGPPKLQLDGNKWVVENHGGNNSLLIENPEIKHVVYVYNCQNSTLTVKGKVNAITIGIIYLTRQLQKIQYHC
jgi:adenylyl cyclase-associated protein